MTSVDAIGPGEDELTAAKLLPGETVAHAFRTSTGALLFTDRRILVLRREVVLFERRRTSSFSYRAMTHFAVLEGGSPDECRDELVIWLGSDADSLHLRANPGTGFADLEQLLAKKLV